jgi:superfamily II DNA or RNA helicase
MNYFKSMMQLQVSKSNRQEKGITLWRNSGAKGTLNYIMGFGKTRVAKLIVDRTLNRNPNRRIIAIAPNKITQQNLINNLDYRVEVYSSGEVLTIINSGSEYMEDCYLVVVDEIHKFFTPERERILKYFMGVECFKLGLTGSTMPESMRTKLNKYGFPIIDRIDETEALDNNWISNYREYNLAVPFTEEQMIQYKKLSIPISDISNIFKGLDKVFNAKTPNLFGCTSDVIYACYNGRKIGDTYVEAKYFRLAIAKRNGWTEDMREGVSKYQDNIIKHWHPDNIRINARKYNSAVRSRYELISRNSQKLNTVVSIIERNDVPTIIFNDSIDMVEDIAFRLGRKCLVYHSKLEPREIVNPMTGEPYKYKNGNTKTFGITSLRKLIPELMYSGTHRYLVCAQALNEGLDIPLLQQVICTAGSTDPISYAQKVARGKRYDGNSPNKVLTIVNLYHDDFVLDGVLIRSRDKQKLLQRQAENDCPVTFISDITEIEYN